MRLHRASLTAWILCTLPLAVPARSDRAPDFRDGASSRVAAAPIPRAVERAPTPPAVRQPLRPGLREAAKPAPFATQASVIDAAVTNPCQGLAITRVFPANLMAGESFLVLGCGFGPRPVALVDAAAGVPLAIDSWSENVIQARHPGGSPTARLRVIAASGEATAPHLASVGGTPIRITWWVENGPVDVLSGMGFFHWSPSGADEYAVECRVIGAAVPPKNGVFTEVARLPGVATQGQGGPSIGGCPPNHLCWQPGAEPALSSLGVSSWLACRVRALQGGVLVARSNYVVGRMSAARDDNFFVVEERRAWSHLLESEP